MTKNKRKGFVIVLLVLAAVIMTGGAIMLLNSADTLIRYKEPSYSAAKTGDQTAYEQGMAYRRENLPVQLSLSGTHYEMGLQYGVLLKDETRAMANDLYAMISYYASELKLPKDLVYLYFKIQINKLVKHIPERFKEEIKGISEGSGVSTDAIYAISVFDDLLHSMGCTSIVSINKDGPIVHGRTEDLYFGKVLGLRQVIIRYNPTGYNSFTTISFPGFVGASTAYNSSGLGYSHHSRFAKKCDLNQYSQFFVPRLALEECDTLEEVVNTYRDKPIAVADAHTWSDRNHSTACIIETATDEQYPIKVTEMTSNTLWHVNRYLDSDYIEQDENLYTADASFNTARQEIFNNKINAEMQLTVDDIISLFREEEGPNGENYNLSARTRGISNIDTQEMTIFDPLGKGIYFARNYYFASRSTVYFIPADLHQQPTVYQEAQPLQPLEQEIAEIKESMLTPKETVQRLGELAAKYPDAGCVYFMLGEAAANTGDYNEWAKSIEKAYALRAGRDTAELTLEMAKVAFFKKDLPKTKTLLAGIDAKELLSYESRAKLLYLNKMYFEQAGDKAQAQSFAEQFKQLVPDAKTQNKIINNMRFLKT